MHSVVNPLCIILVKNGSKGDRLLFRYPYAKEYLNVSSSSSSAQKSGIGSSASPKSTSTPNSASTTTTSNLHRRKDTLSNVSSIGTGGRNRVISDMSLLSPPPVFEDEVALAVSPPFDRESRSGSMSSRTRKTSRVSPAALLAGPGAPKRGSFIPALDNSLLNDVFIDEGGEGSGTEGMDAFSPADGKKMLDLLSDKDLSNLLSVGSDLSERKFELKLNFLRFVGHPTLMLNPNSFRPVNKEFQTSVKLFHVVFCLNAVATHSIVKCFHDLSKRIGIALRHEEYRCGYLCEQMKRIISLHDEATPEQSESTEEEEQAQMKMFAEILKKSDLAQLLKRIYDDVVERGRTFVRVNNWIQISFALPQKIHTLPYRDGQTPLVEPEAIHRCLEAIRPYHAILLLVDPDELSDSLWLDASSTIPRLLQVYSPLKSLQTMAADADLTLSQVVEIASHLVYWAQATVIYPLCESNIYVIASDVPITNEELRTEFNSRFPSLSFTQTMADFSLPMPLGERVNPVVGGKYMQAQQVELVTWMLKHHLLVHVHVYVYLTTYFDGSMLEAGMDYLTLFTGDPDSNNFNFSLQLRPFEADGDEDGDATASDTFSETTQEPEDIPGIVADALLSELGSGQSGSGSGGANMNKDGLNGALRGDSVGEEFSTESQMKFKGALSELNEAVRRAVNQVKTPLTIQDIKMFSRLSKYFTGDFHIEEIMYRENVRRSQLMLLVDKFRDVLIIVEKEDSEINFFKRL